MYRMAYINLHGQEYIYNGIPAQFALFVKEYGRRLAWGAPSPAYVPMNVPPVFRRVLPSGATVLVWDDVGSVHKDELEAMFEYEVLYPVYGNEREWRPAKGFIKVVSLPTQKSLLTVWTTLDRSHDSERKHLIDVWEHLKGELVKHGLLHINRDVNGQRARASLHGKLRTLMENTFDLSEIEGICFDLAINYEDLGGSNRKSKIRDLIAYCERSGTLESLINKCRKERPNFTWPDPW
jgi:hypothetical protein